MMKNKKLLSLLAISITILTMTGCSNLYEKKDEKVVPGNGIKEGAFAYTLRAWNS